MADRSRPFGALRALRIAGCCRGELGRQADWGAVSAAYFAAADHIEVLRLDDAVFQGFGGLNIDGATGLDMPAYASPAVSVVVWVRQAVFSHSVRAMKALMPLVMPTESLETWCCSHRAISKRTSFLPKR